MAYFVTFMENLKSPWKALIFDTNNDKFSLIP